MACKFLSQEEELELFKSLRTAVDNNDDETRDALITKILVQYSPLVTSRVRDMKGYHMDVNDMMSEANCALAKAALKYDYTLGFRFSTFAQTDIRLTLLSYVSDNYLPTRISSSHAKKAFFRVRRELAYLSTIDDGDPITIREKLEKVANANGLDVEDVSRMFYALTDHVELDRPISTTTTGGLDTSMDVFVKTESHEHEVFDKMSNNYRASIISEAVNTLPPRAKDIFMSRCMHSEESTTEAPTLKMLSDRYGISRERVRQIQASATKDVEKCIRDRMAKDGVQLDDVL